MEKSGPRRVSHRDIIAYQSKKIRSNWSGQIISEKESRNEESKVERSNHILEEKK